MNVEKTISQLLNDFKKINYDLQKLSRKMDSDLRKLKRMQDRLDNDSKARVTIDEDRLL